MTEPAPAYSDDMNGAAESPLHGYRGEAGRDASPILPIALTIAISREAGARGGTIARRAGAKLGWQVYGQDLLEYMVQDGSFRQELLDQLPANASAWVESQLHGLLARQNLSRNPSVLDLARNVLFVAAQGEAILLGRGSGCILPSVSTLNVRLFAPFDDRVAYMAQWLRLTEAEAAEQVRKRDKARGEFVLTHFHREPADLHQYDLLLNSSFLGEERCADLIVQAAHAKQSVLHDE